MVATRKPRGGNAAIGRPPYKLPVVESAVVEGAVPYLVVTVRAHFTEKSAVPVFELIRDEIVRHGSARVLVDMRESSVSLTISDMFGVAKLTASSFAGVLERLALVVRSQDLLDEKFFEPSLRSRGVPTVVTSDSAEATYWITMRGTGPR